MYRTLFAKEATAVKVKVEGELVHTQISGFGPFKRVRRTVETFDCLLTEDGQKLEALDGLHFDCRAGRDSWVLQGGLMGIDCTFGEFPLGNRGDSISFVMVSVVGWELRGKATILEPGIQAQKNVFVA